MTETKTEKKNESEQLIFFQRQPTCKPSEPIEQSRNNLSAQFFTVFYIIDIKLGVLRKQAVS
jgi:hypothetical protein